MGSDCLPFSLLGGVLWDRWRISELYVSRSSISQFQESGAPSLKLLPVMQQ